MEDVLKDVPEVSTHYHIVVETKNGMDAMKVQTELRPEAFTGSFEETEALRKRIKGLLSSTLLVGVDVALVEPGGIERAVGKAKHVTDNRLK